MTTNEIAITAGTDVIRLINMQLSLSDAKEFLENFTKKVSEMLEARGTLFIGFGPGVTKDGAFFTEDMQEIMQFVSQNTKKQYSFRKGRLLMYLSKEKGTGIWEDD